METMSFGLLALIALSVTGWCLHCKKPFQGLIGTAVSIVLLFFTGYSWKKMLIESGKSSELLCFSNYPAALIILAMLSLGAAVSAVISVIQIVKKQRKS